MATITSFANSGFNYFDNRTKTQLDANEAAINTELTSTTATAGTALQNVVEDTTPQLGGSLDLNGNGLTGVLNTPSTATLSGAGAIPITATIAEWTTTGADAGTLADGAEGQQLFVVMVVDGGNGTLTPSNLAGGTTITFDAVGDSVHLLFTAAAWYIVGSNGVVVA